jgi:hypothetical protein
MSDDGRDDPPPIFHDCHGDCPQPGAVIAEILPVLLLAPVAGAVVTACPGSASWSRRICGAPCWQGCCRWPIIGWRPRTRWYSGCQPARCSSTRPRRQCCLALWGKRTGGSEQRPAVGGGRAPDCARATTPARPAHRGPPPRGVISARRHRRIPGLREIRRATRSASFVTCARSSAFSAFSSAFSARSAITTSVLQSRFSGAWPRCRSA